MIKEKPMLMWSIYFKFQSENVTLLFCDHNLEVQRKIRKNVTDENESNRKRIKLHKYSCPTDNKSDINSIIIG